MRWDGAMAVVTGASRGIGRAVARAAAAKGARVGLVAGTEGDLRSVLAEAGGDGAVATADVSDRRSVEAALAQLVQELGPVDILVNNAGIGAYGKVADTDVDVFERLMQVNYFGTVYATKAVLAPMIDRRRGHIVNVASVAGRFGVPLEAAYSASKFAVVGLTEGMAVELEPLGIGVSMVNPGPVDTEFFATRGHPYAQSWPKPVPAERVADAVIVAVERNRREQVIPRALRSGLVVKEVVPPFYRSGTARNFARQTR